MPAPLKLYVVEAPPDHEAIELTGKLELGRCRSEDTVDARDALYRFVPANGGSPDRFLIAQQNEPVGYARQHVLLEPLPNGLVRVQNLSGAELPFDGPPSGVIPPRGGHKDLTPP